MISITLPFNKALFIKANKLRFRLENKNSFFWLFLYIIITVGLMILISFDKSPSSFYGIVGVILSVLTMNYIIRIINLRGVFLRKIELVGEKYENLNFTFTFEFNDEDFTYIDDEKKFQVKWKALSGYSIKKDYFILFIDKKIYSMLHRSEVSFEQFNEIIELSKSKLSYFNI
ncbi:hypothetical protein [Pedobacter punctiformis]|uniref:YcxB-like protein domain-containing protein n=1 Tax=Pedobacter punctiformis TaxID=3004097 RepID=A0ABT4L730_9SPHI|nr:hypothetical protein [Pedobacter sp. HCMS5-2]MCZ4243741.1 hypothetical protein [Pedobacter sp. HCMS5-2]